MRTEEILQRNAEYRAIREALGRYDVSLVLAQPSDDALQGEPTPDDAPAPNHTPPGNQPFLQMSSSRGLEGPVDR
jgi:hypothetical protein